MSSDIINKIKLIASETLTLNSEDIKLISDTLEGYRLELCRDADKIRELKNENNQLKAENNQRLFSIYELEKYKNILYYEKIELINKIETTTKENCDLKLNIQGLSNIIKEIAQKHII